MESNPSFKEYDLDSYSRKWKQTIAKLKLPTGSAFVYIRDFKYDVDGNIHTIYCFPVDVGTPGNEVYDLGISKDQPSPEFLYHHFETGYYTSPLGTQFYCLARKNRKTFRCGMSDDGFYFPKFTPIKEKFLGNASLLGIDFTKPAPLTKDPFKTIGPIAPRLFISDTRLFYLTVPIGLVNKKERSIVMIEPSLNQEVQDALRDHPCTIIS